MMRKPRDYDSELKVLADKARRERGGIVKLSVQRDVETVGTGSLVDPQSAMEQIVNTLRDWAARGKIDCRFE